MPDALAIRPFRPDDESAVVRVWHRSGKAAYPYLPLWQSMSLEKAHEIFREAIAGRCQIQVGTRNEQVVAFLAMDGSTIDRMYVDPDEWRSGWGARLALRLDRNRLNLAVPPSLKHPFWLRPVRLDRSRGFGRPELRRIEGLVENGAESLLRSWNEYFAG